MSASSISLGLYESEVPAGDSYSSVLVVGDGPIPAKLMIIGEAPGEEEDSKGVPFVGPSGKLLDECLKKVGIDRKEVFITNVVKRKPITTGGAVRTPSVKELEVWIPLLKEEINSVNPEVILMLGNIALKAIHRESRPITQARGIVGDFNGVKTLSTFHPAAALRRDGLRPVLVSDLVLIKEIMDGKERLVSNFTHRVITNVRDAKRLVEYLLKAGSLAFDIETNSLNWVDGKILCVVFSPNGGEAYVIPLLGRDCQPIWKDTEESIVKDCINSVLSSDIPKIAQNASFDIKFLTHNGFQVNNLQHDTLIEHHLINENFPHNLEFIANYELGKPGHDEELRKHLPTPNSTYDKVPNEVLWRYAAFDADYTMSAHKKFIGIIKGTSSRLMEYYHSVAIPLEKALIRMEIRGVKVDMDRVMKLKREYTDRLGAIHRSVQDSIGSEINLNSTKQLIDLFFGKLGYKPVRLNNSGTPSVDEKTIGHLAQEYNDIIASSVLEYRRIQKNVGSYIDGSINRVDKDGRIHTEYRVTGTVTWRLSSRNPNLQGIPDDMRGIFVPEDGYLFGGGDYKQIEMVVMASLAGESKMIDLYNEGLDMHLLVAQHVFKIDKSEVTKPIRDVAKGIGFGIVNGLGSWSLAKKLGVNEAEAQELVNQFFEAFPSILPWKNKVGAEARRIGYVESPFGFRRNLDFEGLDDKSVSALERQAVNSPIQGGAATITNKAHIELESMYQRGDIKSIPVLTVHDALYFCIPENNWNKEVGIIKEVMQEHVPELGITPRVSFEVGTRWGDSSVLKE